MEAVLLESLSDGPKSVSDLRSILRAQFGLMGESIYYHTLILRSLGLVRVVKGVGGRRLFVRVEGARRQIRERQ